MAYVVELDADGQPLAPQPTSRIDPSNQRGRRGLDMIAPEVKRSITIRPLLLADKGEYTFGRSADPDRRDRAKKCHEAYLDLLAECAQATAEPSVVAVQRFFGRGGPDLLDLPDSWDYQLKVTFRVHLKHDERWPIREQSVQQFWAQHNTPKGATGQCLVCGQQRPVLDRLKSSIKGIPGGHTAGTSMISANSKAFESYGLKASRTSPTCQSCAEGFTPGPQRSAQRPADLRQNRRRRFRVLDLRAHHVRPRRPTADTGFSARQDAPRQRAPREARHTG